MKHVRTFENINRVLQVGDYVICEDKRFDLDNKILVSFLSENVGLLVEIDNGIFPYNVKYENTPHEIKSKFDQGVRSFSVYETRLATDEEIEQQKLKNKTHEYNL